MNENADIVSKTCGPTSAEAWPHPLPWSTMRFPSKWIVDGCEVQYPQGEPYIPLVYYWVTGQECEYQWERIIRTCPELANGWTLDEYKEMKLLLNGQSIILGSRLCLIPEVPFKPKPGLGEEWSNQLVVKAHEHARHGRIPVLKDETLQAILDANTPKKVKAEVTPTLFGELTGDSRAQRW